MESSKEQPQARRTQRATTTPPPSSETDIPIEPDTEKSPSQLEINGSPRFMVHDPRPINASDLLPQLDRIKRAVSSPPHLHQTDPTCLNTTLNPSQLEAPTVTELNTHQPQNEMKNPENHGNKLFSVLIRYGANQILNQTLLPPSRDQPKDQQPSRDQLKDQKPKTHRKKPT